MQGGRRSNPYSISLQLYMRACGYKILRRCFFFFREGRCCVGISLFYSQYQYTNRRLVAVESPSLSRGVVDSTHDLTCPIHKTSPPTGFELKLSLPGRLAAPLVAGGGNVLFVGLENDCMVYAIVVKRRRGSILVWRGPVLWEMFRPSRASNV